jgi:hypothetical protein
MDIKEKVSSLRSSQNLKKEEARVCFQVRIPVLVRYGDMTIPKKLGLVW